MTRQPSGPRPAQGPSPDSRTRRRLLVLAGGGGLLVTSGCLSALGESEASSASADLTRDRLAFADGFDGEAASLRETYGEHGVWGLADGPGVDGPTYVGAYRDSLAVPGGDGNANAEPWVAADVAAAVYRLDGGARRVWLWAGARARQPDGGLGRSSLTRLSVGSAAGEGWTLADFAPRGAVREGPVPVSLDDRGPSGRTPLPGGGIAPEEGARTGPDASVGVAWRGIARGTRSANAACEFRPTGGSDTPLRARVSFGVAGGRGAL